MSDMMTTFEVPPTNDNVYRSAEVSVGFNRANPEDKDAAYDNCPPAASHTCDECKRDNYSVFLDVTNSDGDSAWTVMSVEDATRLRDHLTLMLNTVPGAAPSGYAPMAD